MLRRSFSVDPQRNEDRVQSRKLRENDSWFSILLSPAGEASCKATTGQGFVVSIPPAGSVDNHRLYLRGRAGTGEGGKARRAIAPTRSVISMQDSKGLCGSSEPLVPSRVHVRADLIGIEVPETSDRTDSERTGNERSAISDRNQPVTFAFARESSARCRAGGPTIAVGETPERVSSLVVAAPAIAGLDIAGFQEPTVSLPRVVRSGSANGLRIWASNIAPTLSLGLVLSDSRAA